MGGETGYSDTLLATISTWTGVESKMDHRVEKIWNSGLGHDTDILGPSSYRAVNTLHRL